MYTPAKRVMKLGCVIERINGFEFFVAYHSFCGLLIFFYVDSGYETLVAEPCFFVVLHNFGEASAR